MSKLCLNLKKFVRKNPRITDRKKEKEKKKKSGLNVEFLK